MIRQEVKTYLEESIGLIHLKLDGLLLENSFNYHHLKDLATERKVYNKIFRDLFGEENKEV